MLVSFFYDVTGLMEKSYGKLNVERDGSCQTGLNPPQGHGRPSPANAQVRLCDSCVAAAT